MIQSNYQNDGLLLILKIFKATKIRKELELPLNRKPENGSNILVTNV